MKKYTILAICGILTFIGYKIYQEEMEYKRMVKRMEVIKKDRQHLDSVFDDIIKKDIERYKHLANSVEGSIKLARECGVPEEEILHNLDEVNKFFLD